MMKTPYSRPVVAATFACALVACADVKPFEYTPGSEIPPGPGLFSGEDGEFVILGSPQTETEEVPTAEN